MQIKQLKLCWIPDDYVLTFYKNSTQQSWSANNKFVEPDPLWHDQQTTTSKIRILTALLIWPTQDSVWRIVSQYIFVSYSFHLVPPTTRGSGRWITFLNQNKKSCIHNDIECFYTMDSPRIYINFKQLLISIFFNQAMLHRLPSNVARLKRRYA